MRVINAQSGPAAGPAIAHPQEVSAVVTVLLMVSVIVAITLSLPAWLHWHRPRSLVQWSWTHVGSTHLTWLPAFSSPEEAPGTPPSPALQPPRPPACGPQAHSTPTRSETLTHPQELRSHAHALPWALASVTGVWGWVHPLRTLCFGNISLVLGASEFLSLNQRQCFWKGCFAGDTRRDTAVVCWVAGMLRKLPMYFATWISSHDSLWSRDHSRWKHEALGEKRQAPGYPVPQGLSYTLNLGLQPFHPVWYLLQICRNIAALSINSSLSNFLKFNSLIQTIKDYYILVFYWFICFICWGLVVRLCGKEKKNG